MGVAACVGVALVVVSRVIGTRNSACDVHVGACAPLTACCVDMFLHVTREAQDKGFPEGKYRISVSDMCGDASVPLTACCGDLPAAREVPGSGVKVTLCVTCTARDGSLPEGPS